MVRAGWAAKAVAIDRASAPLERARARVYQSGVADRVILRQGEGLAPLAPGEIDTVVVAGMGGRTATDILEPGRLGRLGVRRIIVQPNRDDALVRDHLCRNGWTIHDEALVLDGGRFFYALTAEPGPARTLDPLDLWLGPRLRHRQGPLVDAFRRIRLQWLQSAPQTAEPAIRAVIDELSS